MCVQQPRPTRDITTDDAKIYVATMRKFAKDVNISMEAAVKIFELMAYERRTNVMIDNGNFTDENMCGIGTAIKDIAENLHEVAQALEEIAKKGE